MTSLPIGNSQPQSPGNAASSLPACPATDSLAVAMRPAEPFAFLLAQQIGKADLSVQDTAQPGTPDGIAAEDSGAARIDAQDHALATAAAPPDPANTVAAIMLQIPTQENPEQKTGEQPSPALPSFHKADNRQAVQPMTDTPRKAGNEPAIALAPSRDTGRQAPMANPAEIIRMPAGGHLPTEAIKRPELPSLLQPAPFPVQAFATPEMATAIPSMPAMPANTAPADPLLTMTAPFGSNGWADELVQKISWISTQQNQVAELRLNPPNLGPLDVVLKISDNQATALFASPHGAVREAVENALPKLREILADNGIMLGNATISDQPPRDRSPDGFMNRDSGAMGQRGEAGTASGQASPSPAAQTSLLARRHNGMVDTFA